MVGSKLVEKLKQERREAIAAAPSTGVNTIAGEGLADALAGAQVVVDVANSPSFEDQAAMGFAIAQTHPMSWIGSTAQQTRFMVCGVQRIVGAKR